MNEYSFSIPLTNIALLYIYAVTLRVVLFDYKVPRYFWNNLLDRLRDKKELAIELKNKKTIKKGSLYIYLFENNVDSNFCSIWEKVYNIVYQLNACSFCKGCWGGYIVYSLFILDPNTFHLDLMQVIDFAMFSWSCGVVSLIASLKLGV